MEALTLTYDRLNLSYEVVPWSQEAGMQRVVDRFTRTSYVFDKEGRFLSRNTTDEGSLVEADRGQDSKVSDHTEGTRRVRDLLRGAIKAFS